MLYAIVEVATGLVIAVSEVSQEDIDAGYDFGPAYLVIQSDTTNVGDLYNSADGTFAPPPPPPPPVLTPEEILAANTQKQIGMLQVTPQSLVALFAAIDLGTGTDAKTVKARAWQTFYADVAAVDLTAASPAWPAYPA